MCIRSFRGLATGAIHLYLDMTDTDLKFCGYWSGYFLNGCESDTVFNLKVDIEADIDDHWNLDFIKKINIRFRGLYIRFDSGFRV